MESPDLAPPLPPTPPAPPPQRAPGVRLRFDGPCARITLAAPPLHILDLETIQDLAGALAVVERRGTVSVLILDAEGDRAFSAGVDIRDHTPDKIRPMLAGFHGVLRQLLDLSAVSVAVVRGPALGGGCELALACDLVLAAEAARFGQPEIDVGCFPPGAAVLLPRIVGRHLAAELLLTGRPVTARRAAELGLVNRVLPAAELAAAVEELAAVLAAKSPAVLRIARAALRAGGEGDLPTAFRAVESIYMEDLACCPDLAEGVAAFLEKRPPRWSSSEPAGSPP
ncbi:MAG: enoyl-CoA hydratase/isomerase family protein [Planctomycetes bacterium]|nr:enoyl-CoA hydratase/isomerase family protein [Planctomycetota bacterium]